MDIRPATAGDAAGIAAVHTDSFLATYRHLPVTRRAAETGLAERVGLWERRLRREDRTTVVAAVGDRVVGFVHIGESPDPDEDRTGQVLSIHVSPGSRGNGIGTRLMAEAVAALEAGGYRHASLWVVADNQSARRFYERLGWDADGTSRREMLAVGDEEGDEVVVVRYRREFPVDTGRENP